MTWKIEPLKDKYYGTYITSDLGLGSIKIWGVNTLSKPSIRELKRIGSDPDWDVNNSQDISEYMCDGHYEDAGDYEIALKICEMLNKE